MSSIRYDPKVAKQVTKDGKKYLSLFLKNFNKDIMKKIAILLIAMTMFSCTSSNDFEKGKSQLEQQGYTDVENTGYNAFCCDNKDNYSTGFKAKNSKGETVEGCFCSGVLKGVTIRFD